MKVFGVLVKIIAVTPSWSEEQQVVIVAAYVPARSVDQAE